MGRATSTAMDALHGTMARLLTEELVRAGAAAAREENPVPINPQLLDKVLKFLKDNGIDSPEKNAAIAGLAAALDNLDLDYTQGRVQ